MISHSRPHKIRSLSVLCKRNIVFFQQQFVAETRQRSLNTLAESNGAKIASTSIGLRNTQDLRDPFPSTLGYVSVRHTHNPSLISADSLPAPTPC